MQGIPASQSVPCNMHIIIMGIACIPAIPVILKFPHSDFHYNICREFDITGILWGFPALYVGKPYNNIIFGDIYAKFAGISCKF